MNETKFKPGDKVRVKSDLEVHKTYGSKTFVQSMTTWRGKEVTIQKIGYGDSSYRINEDIFSWTDEMFEEIVPEYVEAVQNLTGIVKGKIYPYINKIVRDGTYNNYSMYPEEKNRYFKPSTKKAYEAQFKPVTPEYIKLTINRWKYGIKGRIYMVSSWKAGNVWVKCNLPTTEYNTDATLCMDSLYINPTWYTIATEQEYLAQAIKPKVKQLKEESMKQFKVGDTVEVVTPCKSSGNKKGLVGKITQIKEGTLSDFGSCTIYEINNDWWEHSSGLKLYVDSKPTFEKDCWYTLLNGKTQLYGGENTWFVKSPRIVGSTVKCDEYIFTGSSGRKFNTGTGEMGTYDSYIYRKGDVNIPEIQNHLPKGHVDKVIIPKFEVGKWYKNLGSSKTYIGKFVKIEDNDKWWCDGYIYKGNYNKMGGYLTSNFKEVVECTIEEIQQYLPENHPDKVFVPKLGDYVTDGDVISIYHGMNSTNASSMLPTTGIRTSNGAYCKTNAFAVGKLRLETPEERQWLDASIKSNMFVSREEALNPKPKEWSVGTYVVTLTDKLKSRSYPGETVVGKVYKIVSGTPRCPYIKGERGDMNFLSSDENESTIKWFATLSEAEAFSKELLTPKITVESEMQRLGLTVGDRVKVGTERVFSGFYRDGDTETLSGECGAIHTIREGFLHNDVLYLEPIMWSGGNCKYGIIASAVTKIEPEFKLGSYTVDVSTTKVKIGCTPLDRDKVVKFLQDFVTFSDTFEDNESHILLNDVKITFDIANNLLEYIDNH